jgi:hypothetical protein
MAHQLATVDLVSRFVGSGRAVFSLRSTVTGTHITYRVTECGDKPGLFFVSTLRGPDNESDYSYIGFVRNGRFSHGGHKARMGADSQPVRGFAWFWSAMAAGRLPTTVEVYHEGRCGRCGRTLTVPESIATGLGPECAEKLGVLWAA